MFQGGVISAVTSHLLFLSYAVRSVLRRTRAEEGRGGEEGRMTSPQQLAVAEGVLYFLEEWSRSSTFYLFSDAKGFSWPERQRQAERRGRLRTIGRSLRTEKSVLLVFSSMSLGVGKRMAAIGTGVGGREASVGLYGHGCEVGGGDA